MTRRKVPGVGGKLVDARSVNSVSGSVNALASLPYMEAAASDYLNMLRTNHRKYIGPIIVISGKT
jgi:hypothetical protein